MASRAHHTRHSSSNHNNNNTTNTNRKSHHPCSTRPRTRQTSTSIRALPKLPRLPRRHSIPARNRRAAYPEPCNQVSRPGRGQFPPTPPLRPSRPFRTSTPMPSSTTSRRVPPRWLPLTATLDPVPPASSRNTCPSPPDATRPTVPRAPFPTAPVPVPVPNF